MKYLARALLSLSLILSACGGGGGGEPAGSDGGGQDVFSDQGGPGWDMVADLPGDEATPPLDTLGPETAPEDTLADVAQDLEGPDLVPDVASEIVPDVPTPDCVLPEDCQTSLGDPDTCRVWACTEGACVQEPAAMGADCDDGDPCSLDDACSAAGDCMPGPPDDCDDGDLCTEDSCDPVGGCQHAQLPPQPCTDGDGVPGVSTCTGGAWSDCVTSPPCDILVNTGTDGTVNPYIFQAREGKFYVSFVENTPGGADLKLAWLDPATCQVAQGPFTVNDPADSVYYWGSQASGSDYAGNYYAVWEASSGFGEVGFASSESGTVFSPAMEVVSTSENGQYPALAVPADGTVYLAWSGRVAGNTPSGFEYDPFVTRNDDVFGGGAFTPAVQVAATPIQDDAVALVVSPEGDVYVAWESFQDGSDDGGNIYVAKSSDGGQTFTAPVRVNDVVSEASVGKSNFMAWGDGALHVVWSDERTDSEGDVYYDTAGPSLDFGVDEMVNDDTYRYQEDPSVTVGSGDSCAGTVYVVWQDLRSNDGYDIYGAKRMPGAAGFEANILINPVTTEDQMNPALGVDPGCVVGVTWRDNAGGDGFDIRATFLPLW